MLDLIEGRRAGIFIGVPTMYRLLLEAGADQRDLRSVHLWLSGADVMPPELAERFQRMGSAAAIPGLGPVGRAAFVEGYGLAESAGAVAMKAHLPLPGLGRALAGDAVGVPLPGVRMRVRDGELEVRGPGVTSGYWGDSDATAGALTDDGWLRTGDRASRGPMGTVRFQGRAKDVIKVGGYSVYAVEVEAALAAHPAVAEAAVLGVPDERLGEVPVAAVRLEPGAIADPADLLAEAAAGLAYYKRPRQLVVLDALPHTGTGKVQKDRLRPLFSSRLEVQGERPVLVDRDDDALGVRQVGRGVDLAGAVLQLLRLAVEPDEAVGRVAGRQQREHPPALEVRRRRRGPGRPGARRPVRPGSGTGWDRCARRSRPAGPPARPRTRRPRPGRCSRRRCG